MMQDNTVNFSESIKKDANHIHEAYWTLEKNNNPDSLNDRFKYSVKNICNQYGFKNVAEVSRFLSVYFEPMCIYKCEICYKKITVKTRSDFFAFKKLPIVCKCKKYVSKIKEPKIKPVELEQQIIVGVFVHAEIIKNNTIGHGKQWVKLNEIKVVTGINEESCTFNLYKDVYYFVQIPAHMLLENINKALYKLTQN